MNWKILKRHPFNVVPNANNDDFQDLKTSIAENGYDYKYPIFIFQGTDDSEMMIIDGMQRLTACLELNEEGLEITPLIREFRGTDIEAIDFIRKSIFRRNLESGPKIIVHRELNALKLEKEADERKKRPHLTELNTGLPSGARQAPHGKEAEVEAKELGVSAMTYKRVKAIQKYSPELADKVKQGNFSVAAAYRQVQEKTASEDQLMKINAKKIIQLAVNEAVQEQALKFMSEVVKELKETGKSNIKFKIIRDDK